MTFDKRWLQFEITHGPQSPGAKEDALFWYNAGQSDTEDTVIKEEDSRGEAESFKDGFASGKYHVVQRVKTFATVNEPSDPLTKENLLEFLETLR